ncbi:MAG: hypothetical protein RLY40_601 [Pseudomonadota bacterium]|jgi:Fe-S cluster biogenesis protein NfuA
MNIIHKRENCEDIDSELSEIRSYIKNNMPILEKHRGFIKLHETSNDKIVNKLLESLEDLMEVNNCFNP